MLVHAAGESSPGNLAKNTHAVVLTAKSEDELREIAAQLKSKGVAFVEIIEPDAPYDGALMALGLIPGKKEALRRHLSSLPCLR